MNKTDKIYVAGHTGLVGSAVLRKLEQEGYDNDITATSGELDLRNQQAVNIFFEQHTPDYVFLCAGTVGGILANDTRRAEFIYDNIMMQSNIIHAAYKYGVKKLLAIGSSCIYPRNAPQPIKEDYLLTGELEPTNEPYAVAKIAAIKMCEAYRDQYGCNFITAMPTNLYGPNDHYNINGSHVIPALITKFQTAKLNYESFVKLWGDGTARREFMHVDDCADALIFLINNYDGKEHINIGTGEDITIKELACLIKTVVGYPVSIEWDLSMPSGTPRKLLDVSKINDLGWKAKIGLREGIEQAYKNYIQC